MFLDQAHSADVVGTIKLMSSLSLTLSLFLSQVKDIPCSIQTMKVIVDGRGSNSGQL